MRIQVINPNTSQPMTHKIGLAAQAVARPDSEILACCPEHGPLTIEGHFDEAIAAVGVLEEMRKGVAAGVDAHVIACFGDTGVDAARAAEVLQEADGSVRVALVALLAGADVGAARAALEGAPRDPHRVGDPAGIRTAVAALQGA